MGLFSSTANFRAQSADPGAIGAGSIWSDTDDNQTFRRNDANDNWNNLFARAQPVFDTNAQAGDIFHAVNRTFKVQSVGLVKATDIDDSTITTDLDDFTTYADTTAGDLAYPTSGTGFLRVNPTNDVIDGILRTGNGDDKLVRDLGASVSETEWILRFKLNVTVQADGLDSTQNTYYIGLSDSDETEQPRSAQDFIGLRLMDNSTSTKYNAIEKDEEALINQSDGTDMDQVPVVEIVFVEISRTTATNANVSFFSDSGYDNLLEKKSITTASTIDNLRFFTMGVNNPDGTANGTYTTEISQVEFYNKISR